MPDEVKLIMLLLVLLVIGFVGFLCIFKPKLLARSDGTGWFGVVAGLSMMFGERAQTTIARILGIGLVGLSGLGIFVFFGPSIGEPEYETREISKEEAIALINARGTVGVSKEEAIALINAQNDPPVATTSKDDDSGPPTGIPGQSSAPSDSSGPSGFLSGPIKKPVEPIRKPVAPAPEDRDADSTPKIDIEVALGPAEALMAQSGADWEAGKYRRSIANARRALPLFERHLGSEHPKTSSVRAMIEQAETMMSQMDQN